MSIRTVVTRGYGAGASVGAVVLRGYFPEPVMPSPGQPSGGTGGGGTYRDRPEYFGRGAHGDPGGPDHSLAELERLREESERVARQESEDEAPNRADALKAMDALDARLVAIEAATAAQDERTAEIDAMIAEIAQNIALRRALLKQRIRDEEFLLMASA